MAYSTVTFGFGSILYSSTDSTDGITGTWTKIGQTVDLGSPTSEVKKVNVTNNDSPNSSMEYVPAPISDPGDYEFDLISTPAALAALYTLRDAKTKTWFKEVFPDASGYRFYGFVSKISQESKTESTEPNKAKVSIALLTRETYVQSSLS